MKIRDKIISLLTMLAMLGSFGLWGSPALATATVTTPASANISSDSAVSSAVALPALVLTEGAAGDIPVGGLTWSLPTGYLFDVSSIANVTYTGAGLTGSSTVAFIGNSQFGITVTATSTVAGSITIGNQAPLKIKAASGTPIAAPGNILLSAGTLTGVATSTSFGLLTQTPGAANKLAFTVQPPATVVAGVSFSASVGVKDQFGNSVSPDSGRPINLRAMSAANTSTTASSTLAGITTINNNAGVAVFNNLSYPQADSIVLLASSSPLSSILSNTLNITAATTTPPIATSTCASLGLSNGMLVQVQGSPTIYLVVNCTLRPFTSEIIFHKRGKRFMDVRGFGRNFFRFFKVGKDVGDSDDDDIPTPSPMPTPAPAPTPAPTSTPPVISGLPDGSVVKLPGDPTIYLVSGGQLKPFTSAMVLFANHKKFSDVVIISQAQFSTLTVGAPAGLPDGTLIQGSGRTVFVIFGGRKKGIPSMGILQKHGWSLNNIFKLNDGELNGVTDGGKQD